ncbi:MAG: HNH endonuclease [Planctomycetota bacterium]
MSNALAKEGIDPKKSRAAWDELQQLNSKYGELAADAALAAGGALPPPFGTAADVVSLGKSVWTGDWGGALMDVVGFVPIVGDAAKGGKIAKKLNSLRKALDTANATMARTLRQTKKAAKKYWDDLAKANRKAYEQAIKSCGSNKACREAKAVLKGDQYKRTPKSGKNGKWEGERGDGKWVPADGSTPVEYKNGFPDYGPHSKADVEIPMRGDHYHDFNNADAAMRDKLGDPDWQRPDDMTWHHKEDGVTMQLVPKSVHGTGGGATTPHLGGASMHGGVHGKEF